MSEINNLIKIKCSIKNCKHHNSNEYCELTSISIGGNSHTKNYKDTMCQSFCSK